MFYKGERFGFSAWRYNPAWDEHEWGLAAGFGGQAKRDPGTWAPPYRYGFTIVWRKLSNCVSWWGDYIGVERGRGVVMHYRVHSFRQFPISVRFYKAP